MYGFNFSSFTSQLPRACSITSFESPTTSTTLAPAAISDSNPKIQASYSAILLVTGNINFLQIVITSPLGVSSTTPAPAPYLLRIHQRITSKPPLLLLTNVHQERPI